MLAFASHGESSLAELIVDNEIESARRLAEILADYTPEDKAAFGVAIAAAILHGLPQADLAVDFGVSQGTVSRWAAGRSIPPQYVRATIIDRIRERLVASGKTTLHARLGVVEEPAA